MITSFISSLAMKCKPAIYYSSASQSTFLTICSDFLIGLFPVSARSSVYCGYQEWYVVFESHYYGLVMKQRLKFYYVFWSYFS